MFNKTVFNLITRTSLSLALVLDISNGVWVIVLKKKKHA